MLARRLKRHDPDHKAANEKFIVEDLSVMSDFMIHKTCLMYQVGKKEYVLSRNSTYFFVV